MRFIRVHGRVVPIRDSSASNSNKQQAQKHVKNAIRGSLASGVGSGVVLAASHEFASNTSKLAFFGRAKNAAKTATHLSRSTSSLKAFAVGAALSIGGALYAQRQTKKAVALDKNVDTKQGKQAMASIGGFAGTFGAYKGVIAAGPRLVSGAQKLAANASKFKNSKSGIKVKFRKIDPKVKLLK